MHVAVFADMEGSFGIWRMSQCRTGTAHWQYGRECLTADVNHAIQGAFEGGADQVTVKDTHDTGFNCIPNLLDKRAKYVGGHYAKPTFFGDVSDYDLVLYIGIHAASGTPGAFFPHTHYGIFSEVRINGQLACEMDVYGGYLGDMGVPIGMVTGEEIAVRQALRALPWAQSVVVDKSRAAYQSGEKSVAYLQDGRELLRETAAIAVREHARMKPLAKPAPLHFDVTFRKESDLLKFNTWKFKRKGKTVSWDAINMVEGMNKLNKLTFFPKRTYLLRRPILFLLRTFFRLRIKFLSPEAEREGAAAMNPGPVQAETNTEGMTS